MPGLFRMYEVGGERQFWNDRNSMRVLWTHVDFCMVRSAEGCRFFLTVCAVVICNAENGHSLPQNSSAKRLWNGFIQKDSKTSLLTTIITYFCRKNSRTASREFLICHYNSSSMQLLTAFAYASG